MHKICPKSIKPPQSKVPPRHIPWSMGKHLPRCSLRGVFNLPSKETKSQESDNFLCLLDFPSAASWSRGQEGASWLSFQRSVRSQRLRLVNRFLVSVSVCVIWLHVLGTVGKAKDLESDRPFVLVVLPYSLVFHDTSSRLTAQSSYLVTFLVQLYRPIAPLHLKSKTWVNNVLKDIYRRDL